MEKIKHFYVAHFATPQDMQGALRRVADDVRNARGGPGPDNKTVKATTTPPDTAPAAGKVC
jgi:hypothetical protein